MEITLKLQQTIRAMSELDESTMDLPKKLSLRNYLMVLLSHKEDEEINHDRFERYNLLKFMQTIPIEHLLTLLEIDFFRTADIWALTDSSEQGELFTRYHQNTFEKIYGDLRYKLNREGYTLAECIRGLEENLYDLGIIGHDNLDLEEIYSISNLFKYKVGQKKNTQELIRASYIFDKIGYLLFSSPSAPNEGFKLTDLKKALVNKLEHEDLDPDECFKLISNYITPIV